MSIGKLILHSGSAESSLSERESFIDSLREIGLLGKSLDPNSQTFLTGERFLQLISFVGCSTNVCLTPKSDSGESFCHLKIKGPLNQPLLVFDKNSRPPRCPACKTAISGWKDQVDNQMLKCDRCEKETALDKITWGRQAGYGRIFIEINNIFPGEARPVHELLASLGKLTDSEWRYFFTES